MSFPKKLFRWVLKPSQEVTLRVLFTSEKLDVVDQTLSFELLGTKKNYQLFCRGTCAFPTIVTNPKTIFPRLRKNSIKSDEIVLKQYVVPESTFYFGPLLVGKTRERYQEGRYPENMEKLTLFNEGPLTAEARFQFNSTNCWFQTFSEMLALY